MRFIRRSSNDCANRKHRAENNVHGYDLLTQREREVLALVVTGVVNKQITAKLGTTEFTVKIQRGGSHANDASRSFAGWVRIESDWAYLTLRC